MKVIDARTGKMMEIGQPVVYDDGERVTLLEVEPGILSARARVRSVQRQGARSGAPLITREQWVPLAVRFTHPAYFLQHVAFFPS